MTRVEPDVRAAAPTLNGVLFGAVRRGTDPLRRAPWWAKVSLLFLATRLVAYWIFLGVALHQGPSPWGAGQPGYLQFIGIWDSEWYQRIFSGGYPSVLPRGDDGAVQTNAWAFYPLFPLLVRGLNAVTGLGWEVAAPLVAFAAAWAAALMVFVLFRRFAEPATALWGTAFVFTFPASPILQVPYAESLNLLLLAAALYLLSARNYWAALPMVVLMGFSRPTGVPFAAVVGLHLALRWWNRRKDPFPGAELASGAVLLVGAAVAAVAWPVIAWAATGDMRAYMDTETSWRGHTLVLFKPWFDAGAGLAGPLWGWLLPVLLAALAVLYLTSRPVVRLGPDLRLWCAVYLLYLLAVLDPQTSTFRMMLPFFPLGLAAAHLSRSRAYRGAVLVFFVLLQIVWVAWLWRWTELPGGGDYPP
ncbi:hypothetical protein [Specibacter cremeus]|uniref:hypothetical protein n=1 Tax=Specibacter cremeus TaxID=1629051 RepID=UPI001F0C0284|nr:hypothetical protein [Specibacter cremeus]